MSCRICGCKEFKQNPFQKTKCSECLHDHNATPASSSSNTTPASSSSAVKPAPSNTAANTTKPAQSPFTNTSASVASRVNPANAPKQQTAQIGTQQSSGSVSRVQNQPASASNRPTPVSTPAATPAATPRSSSAIGNLQIQPPTQPNAAVDEKAKSSPGFLQRGLSFGRELMSSFDSTSKEPEIEISGPISSQHLVHMEKTKEGGVRTTIVPKELEKLIEEVDSSIRALGDQNGVREEEKEFLIRTLIGETDEQRKSRKQSKRYSRAQWASPLLVDSQSSLPPSSSATSAPSISADASMRKSILKSKTAAGQTGVGHPTAKTGVQFQAGTSAQTAQKAATFANAPASRADTGAKSQREIMDLLQKLETEKAQREKMERQMQSQIDDLRKELKASETKSADLKVKVEDTERKLKTSERTVSEMKVVSGTQTQIEVDSLKKQLEAAEHKISNMDATIKQITKALSDEKSAHIELEAAKQKMQNTIDTLQAEKSKAAKGDELNRIRSESIVEKEKISQKLDNEVKARLQLEKKCSELEIELKKKSDSTSAAEEQANILKSKVADVSKLKDSEIVGLQKLLEESRKEIGNLQGSIKDLSSRLQQSEASHKFETQSVQDRLNTATRKNEQLEHEKADLLRQVEELKSSKKSNRMSSKIDTAPANIPPPPPPPPSGPKESSVPIPPPQPKITPSNPSSTANQPTAEDPRELLLSAIRGDRKLRHVSMSIQKTDAKAALARLDDKNTLNIIARALLERRTNMKEDTDDSSDEDEWD